MSLRTWLARFRPRNAGNVPVPQPYWLVRNPLLAEAGVHINAEVAAQVSAVYGCCRLIVDCLASAPIFVQEVRPGGKKETLHDDPVAYALNYGAPVAQAPDAPTSQAIEEALYWSTLLYGNGYAEIQRDNAGRFFALWPIEPERVRPWRDETGFYYRISSPQTYGGPGGSWTRLEPKDMFHVRGPSLFGWVGDSTVFRAAKAIGIAHAAQVYAAAYFANGTVISGLLTSDKSITQEQANRAKEKWIEEHGGGPGSAHGLSVLGQGLKYQPINHNAQEAQLIEARRFQVHEIARFFGVPTTLLADNEAWTNLSELYLGFYRNALLPWAERFDAEATRKLFPQRAPWREVRHDLTQLVMGSFKDQIAALREAVDGGIWTRNEAREVTGKNHIGSEGDVLVAPINVRSLKEVLNPPEPLTKKQLPLDPGQEPAAEPGANPAKPPPKPAKNPSSVARVAVALDRFERRMSARRVDLEKHAPEKVEANLAEERKRLMPALVEEFRAALDNAPDFEMKAIKAADAVLAGEPAHLAAERLGKVDE